MKSHPFLNLAVLGGLFALYVSQAAGQVQVPTLMNYQGQLADASGNPLATGDYSLTFSIHDAAQGGSQVWGPQQFDGGVGPGRGARIPVVQGYFNVMLGPTDTAGRSLADAFGASVNRFIQIQIGSNAPIAPRQQMLTSPFAFASVKAKNADVATNALAADSARTLGGITVLDAQGKLNASVFATDAITANQLANNSVGTAELANDSVQSAKISTGAVTIDKLFARAKVIVSGDTTAAAGQIPITPGGFDSGLLVGGTRIEVNELTVKLATTGRRPVIVALVDEGSDGTCWIEFLCGGNQPQTTGVRITRNAETISIMRGPDAHPDGKPIVMPPSSFWTIDFPTAGTQTYQVEIVSNEASCRRRVHRVRLVAYEL